MGCGKRSRGLVLQEGDSRGRGVICILRVLEWVFYSSVQEEHFLGLCLKPRAEQDVRSVAMVSEGTWNLGSMLTLSSSHDCTITLHLLFLSPCPHGPCRRGPLTHGSHMTGISGLLLSRKGGYLLKQGAKEDLLTEPLGEAGCPAQPCLLPGFFLSSSHTLPIH